MSGVVASGQVEFLSGVPRVKSLMCVFHGMLCSSFYTIIRPSKGVVWFPEPSLYNCIGGGGGTCVGCSRPITGSCPDQK